MWRLKFLFVSLTLLMVFSAQSQERILYRELESMEEAAADGPNSKNYGHFFIDLGFMADYIGHEESRLKWSSHSFHIGYREKIKLKRKVSFIGDLAYVRSSFRPRSSHFIKGFGEFSEHESQRLIQHGIFGGTFLRFNVGKQGNHLGTFVDFGIYGEAVVYSRLKQEAKDSESSDNVSYFHVNNQSSGISNWKYGLKIRAGYDWFSFWGSYRLSDLFNSSQDSRGSVYYNFAPLTIGVELKLF